MLKKKTYAIDIDGTLCRTPGNEYEKAQPIFKAINAVNKLYDEGNTIKIFTGRGCLSGKDWKTLTELQLKTWGVKYHELLMNKPHFDVMVDDHAINAEEWRATIC
jgi:histidinol phosphatase-like enzyme